MDSFKFTVQMVSAEHVSQGCYSVTQLYPTLCAPVDCSTPGFPVLHRLPEFAQTHVCGVALENDPHCGTQGLIHLKDGRGTGASECGSS